MLDERAAAVGAGEKNAFMATVSDDSPEFVQRQSDLFDRMQEVPLGSYELRATWSRYGDLVRPSDRRRYAGAEDVKIAVVEERYRISGYDPAPAVEDLFYTFVRREGEWRIAEDTDLDDLALYSARHLWDFGPVETRRSRHFLLIAHPCSTDTCDRLNAKVLELAEEALDQTARYWHGPWRQKTVILVPDEEQELARMIQSTFDLDSFVAFAYSTVDLTDGVDYTGHRILLNPGAFDVRSDDSIRQIMSHELLHIATRASSGPFVPIFLEEGFADYVGWDGDPGGLSFLRSEIGRGVFDAALPQDFEFTIGDGTSIYRSYQESHSAARFIIDRWGLGTLTKLYRELGSKEMVAGTTRYQIDRALRRVLGMGFGRFQEAWADSIA